MKKQLYRAAAATVLGLSLTTGVVAADTGNISNTGPGSDNNVDSTVTDNSRVRVRNHLYVNNDTDQHAYTGDSEVKWNTTGGDATSGDATNDNSTAVSATVDNSGVTGGGGAAVMPDNSGTIDTTGPGSTNSVSSTWTDNSSVRVTNDITVRNDTDQRASSGDAEVKGNTTGGNATSGNASNTNSSTFTFNVTN